MQTIVITDSNGSYSAYVGHSLIAKFPSIIPHECQPNKIVIIIDKNVNKLLLNALVVSLEKEGFIILIYSLVNDFGNEDFLNAHNFLLYLTEHNFQKSDLLIAFGGSEVCNFTGFFSSLYLYGISYISIPTTLLAMIKTSTNSEFSLKTKVGKDIIGTIHSPIAVLCDIDTLKTISDNQMKDGIAEIIKYAFIRDIGIIKDLDRFSQPEDIISLIAKCLRIKNYFISDDEYNKGIRRYLNFGHTIAVALERHLNYQITYGQAVSVGMAITAKAAEKHNLSNAGTYNYIYKTLKAFNLPFVYDIPLDKLVEYVKKDNMVLNSKLSIVMLKKINQPFVHDVALTNLRDFFGILY